jgi:hypothetical protein
VADIEPKKRAQRKNVKKWKVNARRKGRKDRKTIPERSKWRSPKNKCEKKVMRPIVFGVKRLLISGNRIQSSVFIKNWQFL